MAIRRGTTTSAAQDRATAGTPAEPTETSAESPTPGAAGAADATEADGEQTDVAAPRPARSLRVRVADATPLLLLQAAHPRQALVTAIGVGVAALLSGRPPREVLVVTLTVLVGQGVLGWHNDLADRRRDARHETRRKPVAQGRLDPGTVGFAIAVGVLLVVPLSISVGVTAGAYYLGSLVAGALGNAALRKGRFSPLTWAVSFALLVPYLSYGGWGGASVGTAPQPVMVVVAALLGISVHVARSVYGLVADDQDGWSSVPLRLGRRLGATKLLVLSGGSVAACLVALAVLGATVGLGR